MKLILFGAAGFIGTNLVLELAKNENNIITVVDKNREYFSDIDSKGLENVSFVEADLDERTDYDALLMGQDMVYHLVSTTVPTTSNQKIAEELNANVIMSVRLLDACVTQNVKKVVFLSSGGTVYGKDAICPIKEDTPTNPITSYGVQKVTIEKLLYLYRYLHGLDYRVIRLANPYGPYQRPNGVQGVVTTFIYKALKGEPVKVYGDGSVVRDFIYIEDAVKGILTIANSSSEECIYNLGCGYGISVKEVLETIQKTLDIPIDVEYIEARKVDVATNYLDMGRYETAFGQLNPIELSLGISKTAEFLKEYFDMNKCN